VVDAPVEPANHAHLYVAYALRVQQLHDFRRLLVGGHRLHCLVGDAKDELAPLRRPDYIQEEGGIFRFGKAR
jgi:hypothetical protein